MKGLELSKRFFHEIIRPLLTSHYPDLKYSACLIGSGSEVLGYDDQTSQDHHWGVRLQIFLSRTDYSEKKDSLSDFFKTQLPLKFLGYSTNWSKPDPSDNNNQFPREGKKGDINHRIEFYTLKDFLKKNLGFSIEKPSLTEWCLVPEHQLLEFISGQVFQDDLGIEKVRNSYQYYPEQIWLLKFYALWNEVSELFHLMGRTGSSNQALGSQLLTNRLLEIGIKLVFLVKRTYTPYPKWLGRKFSELDSENSYTAVITNISYEKDWWTRQEGLIKFYQMIGKEFNDLKLINTISFARKKFFTRSYYIIDLDDLLPQLRKVIREKWPTNTLIAGTINELVYLSQPRDRPIFLAKIKGIYE